MAEGSSGSINTSAGNVFDVLRLIAEAGEPLGVSEIGRRLDLPASTVYRALITLEETDFLGRYQNTPRYELGAMPHLLNRALLNQFRLHAVGRPVLRALADATGETVSLTVRLGWYALRLAGVYGKRDMYHRDRLGEVKLLHRSLHGRGILAFLGADEIVPYRRFVKAHHPEGAPAAWKKAEDALARERRAGLAHERLSSADTLAAIALPIRAQDGLAVASLAVSGPVYSARDGLNDGPWFDARDALEQEIAADPAAFASPFAAISPDQIVLRLGADVSGN